MAKKRPKKDQEEHHTVPAPAADQKPSTNDRHKPRSAVHLPPRLYAALKEYARRNRRPINWQLRVILEDILSAEGLYTPTPTEDPVAEDEDD